MSDNPDLEDLSKRLARLEAESAVRRVVAGYFRICDALAPETDLDSLAALFTPDAVWEGRGRYEEAFGRHEGCDAIVAMLAQYARSGHFLLNAHYLASENIEIAGACATGRWLMLQASTYRDGKSDLRSAALTIALVCEDGAWRISRFVTEHILSRQVTPWDDTTEIAVPFAPKEEEE